MKCKLLLTFDHELPLGGLRSSYNEAVFDTTNRLLQLADELQLPVTLFTDVLCGIRFQKWDKLGFYEPYIAQLRDALNRKHDVQLHLHPHWLTSDYDGKTYLPSSDFRLSDFDTHPTLTINNIIHQGVEFLTEIGSAVRSDYRCVAFRAGGYNIQPAAYQIFDSLYDCGIRFDSSICKGYRFSSALSDVDFSNMPKSPNWYIGTDGDIRKEAETGILEIPIAGIPKTIFEIPTRFKLKKNASRAPANHGLQIHHDKAAGIKNRMNQLFSSRMLTFDNYTYTVDYLMKILDYNLHKYSEYDEIMLCAIGHPKTMGDYSMQMFRDFVLKVREKYKEKVQFYTYRQLYNELKIK